METFTFETMPARLEELSNKIDRLLSMQAMPQEETDKLMTIAELQSYLPEKPARQTVYQWVNDRKVPYQKHGKFLYFRKSTIDLWLNNGRHV
jgi:predicted DNA-binding transcriptional regulator AlpA